MIVQLPLSATHCIILLETRFSPRQRAFGGTKILVPTSAIFDRSSLLSPTEQLLTARRNRRKLLSFLRWLVSKGVSVRLVRSTKSIPLDRETRSLLEEIVPGICS